MSRQVLSGKKKKKGYTLVELVVCFALLMIFIGAAAMILETYSRVSLKVTDLEESETVADLLLNKIVDTLSEEKNQIDTGSLTDGKISYANRSGNKEVGMLIFLEDGIIYWNYADNPAEKKERLIGENAYLGNTVENMSIASTPIKRQEASVDPTKKASREAITVTLELKNLRGEIYTDSRTFQCRVKQ